MAVAAFFGILDNGRLRSLLFLAMLRGLEARIGFVLLLGGEKTVASGSCRARITGGVNHVPQKRG
jgi:hypothetical protein